jgi:hypothetical protein
LQALQQIKQEFYAVRDKLDTLMQVEDHLTALCIGLIVLKLITSPLQNVAVYELFENTIVVSIHHAK